MKRTFDKNMLIASVAIAAAVALPSLAAAKVSGPCGNCHTMHNSQDGGAMASTGAFDPSGGLPAAGDEDTTPNGALLRYGCIGCHTGDNIGGTVPFVMSAAAGGPTYGVAGVGATDTLAGGNFYWVDSGNDAAGHNVVGLPSANGENTLTLTPGDDGTSVNATPGPNELTCAGTTGCHGDRAVADEFGAVAGGHHGPGNAATNGYVSGSTTDMSDAFRMLAGVEGIEDADWEYTADATQATADHNMYKGAARASEVTDDASTISSLCAQCHGAFHNGAGEISSATFGSPWVRHPTDFDMSALATTSEYAGYTAYSLEAPVASGTLSGATDITAVAYIGGAGAANGNAIVTCISCHRAHGSPHDDLLRWSYAGMDAHAGANSTGCFACHTTKDDA